MATYTLEMLKHALREKLQPDGSLPPNAQSLSDSQYACGLDAFTEGPNTSYAQFITPQIHCLLRPILADRRHPISILEVGPGPNTILASLPLWMRKKVETFIAYEPNALFAADLERKLVESHDTFPCLKSPATIYPKPFPTQDTATEAFDLANSTFDIVVFCHSMYGMQPRSRVIEKAIKLLDTDGMIVVFHRDGLLNMEELVAQKIATFPSGVVRVEDNDAAIDHFASFVAGFHDDTLRTPWREICRTHSYYDSDHPEHLCFSAPELMLVFTRYATSFQDLAEKVPTVKSRMKIKNSLAKHFVPAGIVRPTEIRHVQLTVRWAVERGLGLTIIGGSHSGHCVLSNIIAIDMSAFDQVNVLPAYSMHEDSLIVAGAGCKSGDIINEAMAANLTVPLGARPSVGAGIWLQGGLGHISRSHGLACDNILGAIIISVQSGQVLCVGVVPSQFQPAGVIRPDNEDEILWGLKGAGTNIGIVTSVTFQASQAVTYFVQHHTISLDTKTVFEKELEAYDELSRQGGMTVATDAYLYLDNGTLHLGRTRFESVTHHGEPTNTHMPALKSDLLGEPRESIMTMDGMAVFDAEMYISEMHGGHGGGKTSSFKRCVFVKNILLVAKSLAKAIETCPTPLCYFHLLQGGECINDISKDNGAFGCRNWEYACVITGVWPCGQDGTDIAHSVIKWVYQVAQNLASNSHCVGVYGADLGSDPRDVALAAIKSPFGANGARLAALKVSMDPHNVLRYACPLPRPNKTAMSTTDPAIHSPTLILLVTGHSAAGKDHCAIAWASRLNLHAGRLIARVHSISERTKREYAKANGANLHRLLHERQYKELHRNGLTSFYQNQLGSDPSLPQNHFLGILREAETSSTKVLVITGMRDIAPVAKFSPSAPNSRVFEIRIQASRATRQSRGGRGLGNGQRDNVQSKSALLHKPDFVFSNDVIQSTIVEAFCDSNLVPLLRYDSGLLDQMIPRIANFPRPSIEFRHVLGIAQNPSGLSLCTSELESQFRIFGDWASVDAIVSCEVGGLLFAAPLAAKLHLPLIPIRKSGKLPPHTISVSKPISHISSLASDVAHDRDYIEMDRDAISPGHSIVVIDDVLASGKTLCAILRLLVDAGTPIENISILVVVELPSHRGREFLWERGFGRVRVMSLMVFEGN